MVTEIAKCSSRSAVCRGWGCGGRGAGCGCRGRVRTAAPSVVEPLAQRRRRHAGGGRVRLAVSRRDRTNGASEAVLSVSDTGIGILRTISTTFSNRSFRAEWTHGPGLAITARIVEDHKGSIEVSSEVGKGTTFVIRFALQPDGPRP